MANKNLIEKEVGAEITKEYDGDNRTQGTGIVYEFDNGEEWLVFDSYDDAEQACQSYVEEMLDDEPETFNQDWLTDFIDEDRLKRDLDSDVSYGNQSYWDDIADENDSTYQNRQIAELIEKGHLDESDVQDDEGNLLDVDDIDESKINLAVEDAVEKKTEEDLKDPIEYLKEIYGDEDGIKKAMEIGGIDTKEASENAVRTDGVAHFFSSYDGNQVELSDGSVMYRLN